MRQKNKKAYGEWMFIGAVFLFVFLWAAVQPFDVSPDERMRYEIVQYLCKYGRLPHGGDPELRNQIWGISYAFNPIISYMISAVFVKIAGIFTAEEIVLVVAARMVNVLFLTGTAWFTLKIGKKLFPGEGKWLFTVLVIFLPGVLFVGSYVNNDAMALFSTAFICYVWVRYLEEGWTVKNCIRLGVGLSICLLSYYNAYGWILVSFLLFTFTALFGGDKAWDFKFWLKRGLIVAAVAAVLAGWWFVRNGILYDGDILGMKTSSHYAQLYAQDGFKPSQRMTPQRQGMSLWDMLWYVPGQWNHNWLITVLVSFVGTFGYMTVFIPYGLSKAYLLFYVLGGAGILFSLRMFGFRKKEVFRTRSFVGGQQVRIKSVTIMKEWDKLRIFHVAMLLAMAIPPVLLLQYAWASDFQAQGRYLLPMVIPMMYFVTKGYENLLTRFVKKEAVRRGFYMAACAVLVLAAVYTFGFVFYPSC
ncbi:MAG: ArnT family glycosyltransferase [Blautia sp.]|jgi:4-amino-4-deoxy-L-arabinose transferase-like glycosyltransferase